MSLNPSLIYNKFLKIRYEGMKKLAEELNYLEEQEGKCIAALYVRQMMITEFKGWEVLSPNRASLFDMEVEEMANCLKQIWQDVNDGRISAKYFAVDIIHSLTDLENLLLWYVKNTNIFGTDIASLYCVFFWFTAGPLAEIQASGYPPEIEEQIRKYNISVARVMALLNDEIADLETLWTKDLEKAVEDVEKWGWKEGIRAPVYARGKNSGGG